MIQFLNGAHRPSNRKGFTIVELLIVIIVVAVLASLTIVSYSGISNKAMTATLQADLSNGRKMLTLYQSTYGGYPASLDANNCPVANGSGTLPADSKYCLKGSGNNVLTYQALPGSTNAFTLYSTNGSTVYVASDSINPTATALTSPCPTGFIPVPGSATYGTSDFCVAKYEAKCAATSDLTTGLTSPADATYLVYNNTTTACTAANSRAVVSVASGYPIAYISQTTATSYGTSACSGCGLITEAQWMTLAQNVLSVPSNWSGGAVGSGYIYSGHNDNAPATALTADTNDANGYSGTGNTSPSNQRRTLTLTNGEVIWDLAGNVWEWTTGQMTGGQPSGMASWNWYQWTAVSGGTFAVNPYPSSTGLAGASGWNSTQGIGQIYGLTSDATLRGFVRGGYWIDGSGTGVLALLLNGTPSNAATSVGFRLSR